MDKLTDKVAYLRGLAEGMELSPDTPERKLLLKMLDVLKDFAEEVTQLSEDQDELTDYVDSIDEDLADIEELLFDEDEGDEDGDGDEDGCAGCGHRHGEDESLEGEMEYECPHCGYQTKFNLADFDFEEDYLCPQCHKSFFPEGEDEDEDEDEGVSGEES